MEVLHHVWSLGNASVADVRERVLEDRDIAYTTIMTVMKNLANKGYLKYKKQGNSYIYSAAIAPENVRYKLIDRLVDKVFEGSPRDLVQTLVKSEHLSEEDRREIKKMIDSMED